MASYTQDQILSQLERLKQNKKRKEYMTPKEYQNFMPETLGFEANDRTLMSSHLQNIENSQKNATLLLEQKMQNRQNYLEMIKRQEQLKRAKQGLATAQSNQGTLNKPGGSSFYGNYEGSRNFGKRWGKDNTPEVSDLRKINPNAPIVTVNWRGRTFQANRQVAPIFVALLDDLWAAGYKPVSIGGHNDRNIAGTNTPSLHSYGLAIDIDPAKNPVQYGTNNHALPPNVAALAAKYGLSWGGSWSSYKDPMHFSVPYGGRE